MTGEHDDKESRRRESHPPALAEPSDEKTRITHIDEGIEFLGWRIQRHRASNGRSYVYTYASKPSLAAVKRKVKAITRCGHNQTLGQLLHRLNPLLRGWCAYFR